MKLFFCVFRLVHHIFMQRFFTNKKISFFIRSLNRRTLLWYIEPFTFILFFSSPERKKKTAKKRNERYWIVVYHHTLSIIIAFPKKKVARQHSFRLNGKSFLDLLVDNPKKKNYQKKKQEKFPISFFSSPLFWKATSREQIFLLLLAGSQHKIFARGGKKKCIEFKQRANVEHAVLALALMRVDEI